MINIYKIERQVETFIPEVSTNIKEPLEPGTNFGRVIAIGVNDTSGFAVAGQTVVTKSREVVQAYYA